MRKLDKHDTLFDGFCHRNYNESIDGWRNAMPDPQDYPCVTQADSVLALYSDLCAARRRIWELEQEVESLRPMRDMFLKT